MPYPFLFVLLYTHQRRPIALAAFTGLLAWGLVSIAKV